MMSRIRSAWESALSSPERKVMIFDGGAKFIVMKRGQEASFAVSK